ncbi:hypothetical protein N0V83_001479 [Neocucurbitaria cava]|uniref:Uncharacterized protein n=1 Tax=Neocucurbitaria cava TaxID=798079 RepID=A0A9W8YFB5_9PLEO|nr:hypothetical protein N0V83_001479 [Neocucurbitaria cava]
MEYGNSYTRPSYSRDDSNHQRVESTDDDTVGMLSQAVPSSQYDAYASLNQQMKPADAPGPRRMSATISPLSAQESTPPQTDLANLPPHRFQQSPPASPGFRPRLFGARDSGVVPYQENVAWANSTQFRATNASDAPKPDFGAQIAEANTSTTPSKQYFREARHFREPWRPGSWARLPLKGFGALALVVLLTLASMSTALSLSRGPFFQRAILLTNGHYQANPTFVVLGIIASLTSVIAILPLYYGYWELGRKVSLNPLEIARAFGAPLFNGLDGNVTSTDIEMERGGVVVKYGACERGEVFG